MGRVSNAEMTEKNPTAWVEGQKAGRAARGTVATQLTELIESSDLTGSPDLVARRVRSYSKAVKSGDLSAQRAALMDLAVAAATTVAGIDVRSPGLTPA